MEIRATGKQRKAWQDEMRGAAGSRGKKLRELVQHSHQCSKRLWEILKISTRNSSSLPASSHPKGREA